jgi:hypothetical protein
MQYIYPSSFAEVSLHLPNAGHLSGKNLPGAPSREWNSGLSYSKPTQFTIRHCPCDYQGLPTLLYLAEENNILMSSVYYLGHSSLSEWCYESRASILFLNSLLTYKFF